MLLLLLLLLPVLLARVRESRDAHRFCRKKEKTGTQEKERKRRVVSKSPEKCSLPKHNEPRYRDKNSLLLIKKLVKRAEELHSEEDGGSEGQFWPGEIVS